MKAIKYWYPILLLAIMALSACGRDEGNGLSDITRVNESPQRFRATFRFNAPIAGDIAVLTDLNTSTKLIRAQWMKVATQEVSEILLQRRVEDCEESSCTFEKQSGLPGSRTIWLTFGRADRDSNYQLIAGNWFGEVIEPQMMHKPFFWNARVAHVLNPGNIQITGGVNCEDQYIDIHEWTPVDRIIRLRFINRCRSACEFETEDSKMQLTFIVTGLGDDPKDITLTRAIWDGAYKTEIAPTQDLAAGPAPCDLNTGNGCG